MQESKHENGFNSGKSERSGANGSDFPFTPSPFPHIDAFYYREDGSRFHYPNIHGPQTPIQNFRQYSRPFVSATVSHYPRPVSSHFLLACLQSIPMDQRGALICMFGVGLFLTGMLVPGMFSIGIATQLGWCGLAMMTTGTGMMFLNPAPRPALQSPKNESNQSLCCNC